MLWLALFLYTLAGVVSLSSGVYRRDWQLVVSGFLAGSAPLILGTLGQLWGHVPYVDVAILGSSPVGTVWCAARLIHLWRTKRSDVRRM